MTKVMRAKPKVEDVQVKLAKLIHEAGRKPVEQRKIYRSDLPVKPFADWEDLDAPTVEGRLMMAAFLLDRRRRASLRGIFASR